MGVAEVLTIVFVVLKLTGVISWSWWLVLLPEIIAVVFYAVVYTFYIRAFLRLKREVDEAFKRQEDD